MKKFFFVKILVLSLSLTSLLLAQDLEEIVIPEKTEGCGFGEKSIFEKGETILTKKPAQEEKEIAKKIREVIGLSEQAFELKKGSVPEKAQAIAIIINKKRYLLYDPAFMRNALSKDEKGWAAMGILAHEIAHFLEGHTLNVEKLSHEEELVADEWAGFILAKLGATAEQAKLAISLLPHEPSKSHPPKRNRLFRVDNGWERGRASISNPSPTLEPSVKPSHSDKPADWPSDLWNTCWNGSYVDFTTTQWENLRVQEQRKYAKSYQEWYAKSKGKEIREAYQKKGALFHFVLVPPGKYRRGSPSSEQGRDDDENQFIDLVSEAIWVGETEVTQEQWIAVMGNNPSNFQKGGSYPVEQVSWDECKVFCRQTGFSLLSETQWEYACRGGTTSAYSYGQEQNELGVYGWYSSNSGGSTQSVKKKEPNSWGLYDMHGNVYEWSEDLYPASESRVGRGGSWFYSTDRCRSANRIRGVPGKRGDNVGLRVCKTL